MAEFYYTAITHNETNEIQYAEHFEDETERNKRAVQLEGEARRLGPWKCYTGTEPVEAFIVRLTTKPTDAETVKEGDDKDTIQAKQNDYTARVDALAAKSGAKTVSVLTAPEIDDRDEARQLPDWAVAQTSVERAQQAVFDAQQGSGAAHKRADAIIDELYGTSKDRPDPRVELSAIQAQYESEIKAVTENRATKVNPLSPDHARAISAQTEADQADARLYLAQQELTARQADYDKIKPKEGSTK